MEGNTERTVPRHDCLSKRGIGLPENFFQNQSTVLALIYNNLVTVSNRLGLGLILLSSGYVSRSDGKMGFDASFARIHIL